jgi:hypothetical protein
MEEVSFDAGFEYRQNDRIVTVGRIGSLCQVVTPRDGSCKPIV